MAHKINLSINGDGSDNQNDRNRELENYEEIFKAANPSRSDWYFPF